MVIIMRKALRGPGFDILTPEGHEEHEHSGIADYASALARAQQIAQLLEAETGETTEISDETSLPYV